MIYFFLKKRKKEIKRRGNEKGKEKGKKKGKEKGKRKEEERKRGRRKERKEQSKVEPTHTKSCASFTLTRTSASDLGFGSIEVHLRESAAWLVLGCCRQGPQTPAHVHVPVPSMVHPRSGLRRPARPLRQPSSSTGPSSQP